MLNPFSVVLAQLLLQSLVVVIIKIKVCLAKNRVLLNDFVEDVDVERQSLCALQLLNELAADGTAHTVLVMQLRYAVCAERVPTMHQDARDTLAHVVLEPTELAYV